MFINMAAMRSVQRRPAASQQAQAIPPAALMAMQQQESYMQPMQFQDRGDLRDQKTEAAHAVLREQQLQREEIERLSHHLENLTATIARLTTSNAEPQQQQQLQFQQQKLALLARAVELQLLPQNPSLSPHQAAQLERSMHRGPPGLAPTGNQSLQTPYAMDARGYNQR
jgi:hypothetical protein